MAKVQLREVCGVRSGDKGDISDLTLFMDDQATYEAVCEAVSARWCRTTSKTSFTVAVQRYEVPNIWALKFVLRGRLGGGGPRSLRSDNLGKTLGGALLRLEVELPDDVVEASPDAAGRRSLSHRLIAPRIGASAGSTGPAANSTSAPGRLGAR